MDFSDEFLMGNKWVSVDAAAETMQLPPKEVRSLVDRGELTARLNGKAVEVLIAADPLDMDADDSSEPPIKGEGTWWMPST